MRKILSKKELEKNKKTKQYIVGGILIFIMLFSTIGYAFQGSGEESSNSKLNYNGFEFINSNGYWELSIGTYNFLFRYNPNQVEKTDAELNYFNSYAGKPLYIYSENSDATYEIYSNLNQIVERMQSACPESEICNKDIPTKNCENNFIIIRESETNKITQNENCVFIEGKSENLTQLTDEFLFKIIGVD